MGRERDGPPWSITASLCVTASVLRSRLFPVFYSGHLSQGEPYDTDGSVLAECFQL